MSIQTKIRSLIVPPVIVKDSSQTIYQSLFFLVRAFRYAEKHGLSEAVSLKREASQMAKKLCDLQKDDGGWDINYEFNFGKLHRIGQATAPETLSLYALVFYGEEFGFNEVEGAIKKAVDWIIDNIRQDADGRRYLPYSPQTTSELMVYNGMSFAAGALASVFGQVDYRSDEVKNICNDLVRYMHDELEFDKSSGAYFLRYPDQKRLDIDGRAKHKTDLYHLGQQLEMHSVVEKYIPSSENKKIIDNYSKFILSFMEDDGYIPYTTDNYSFGKNVHFWGYSSVILGLLEYYALVNNAVLVDASKKIAEFVWQKGYRRGYFIPVVNREGEPVEDFFHARTDAWTINSLMSYLSLAPDHERFRQLVEVYSHLKTCDFESEENGASSPVKRKLLKIFKVPLVIIKSISSR